MLDADAFLAAVEAAPHDPAPRLVFADWLDEHGEADYAAYIRLATHIDRREAVLPNVRKRLRTERHELFERLRADWTERYPVLADSIQNYRGRDVGWLSLAAAAFVAWSGPWPVFAGGRVLIHSYFGYESALAACERLRHVTALDIRDYPDHALITPPFPPASDPLLEMLSESPHLGSLRSLSLHTIFPCRAALSRFADSPLVARLETLSFSFDLDRVYHHDTDVNARQPPAGAIRWAIDRFLGEYGDLLPND